MRIAVIGCGFVGGAVLRWFQETEQDVVAHDPPKHLIADLSAVDVCFVCVPTPFGPFGFDDSIVRAAVADIPGAKTVVIKSTVLPGTTESIAATHPQHRVMFNPEFLRERCAYEDFVNPDRQIVGVTKDVDRMAALDVLDALPQPYNAKGVVAAREAEMVKYFGNCYLSAKITFANQLHDLCVAAGVDYYNVRDWAEMDPRIGKGYLDVLTDGYRGYGGTCFPKDMRALVQLGRALGEPMQLLEACEAVNNRLLAGSEKGRTWLPPGGPQAFKPLTISPFNIRWFGLGAS